MPQKLVLNGAARDGGLGPCALEQASIRARGCGRTKTPRDAGPELQATVRRKWRGHRLARFVAPGRKAGPAVDWWAALE